MKKQSKADLFLLEKNPAKIKKCGKDFPSIKVIQAFNAAVKASGYPLERLKRNKYPEIKAYRQIFYHYCRENKLCSFAVSASFFNQDHATSFNGWQLIEKMIETKDSFYISAIEKFKRELPIVEQDYRSLIDSIRFDAFSMSDNAFYDKYSNLLF